jgi:hypothetical protein
MIIITNYVSYSCCSKQSHLVISALASTLQIPLRTLRSDQPTRRPPYHHRRSYSTFPLLFTECTHGNYLSLSRPPTPGVYSTPPPRHVTHHLYPPPVLAQLFPWRTDEIASPRPPASNSEPQYLNQELATLPVSSLFAHRVEFELFRTPSLGVSS